MTEATRLAEIQKRLEAAHKGFRFSYDGHPCGGSVLDDMRFLLDRIRELEAAQNG